MKLHAQILTGLAAGVVIGVAAKIPGAEGLQRVVVGAEPIGTMFIRLITMVVVPLVVASLFVGIASLGDIRRLGRIGGKTLAYFAVTSIVAATIGLLVAQLANLGGALDSTVRDALTTQFQDRGASAAQEVTRMPSFIDTLIALVPQNPFASAAAGDLLPLIVATCAFGAAATVVEGDGRRAVVSFFQGVNDLAMVIVGWLMRVAPFAVCVLIAATVAKFGVDILRSLLTFAIVVLAALAIHVGVVLIPILRVGAKLSVAHFFRSVSDALLLAFSTASSSATLPVSMKAANERLGVPRDIVSFMLPAGATLNKNGAAVYKAVTAVFIAQLYGVPLGPAQYLTIVVTSTMAAFAGPGVPGSSLVTTLIVLNAIGLGPNAAAGIALVVGIDRPLDMCRTTVNTIGNLIGTAFIARTEGEPLKS